MGRRWKLGLTAGFTLAMSVLIAAYVFPDFVVLTRTDAECEEVGGVAVGYEKILIEVKKGVFKRVQMSRCIVEEVQPRSRRASDTVSTMKGLSTFEKVLAKSGLSASLDGEKSYTLFAPTNAAFDKLPKDELKRLTGDAAAAKAFIARHLIKGQLLGIALASSRAATKPDAVAGSRRQFSVESDHLAFGGSTILIGDLETSNGVIHVIDKVQPEP